MCCCIHILIYFSKWQDAVFVDKRTKLVRFLQMSSSQSNLKFKSIAVQYAFPTCCRICAKWFEFNGTERFRPTSLASCSSSSSSGSPVPRDPFAAVMNDRVIVNGLPYIKLEQIGSGESSKVYRILGPDLKIIYWEAYIICLETHRWALSYTTMKFSSSSGFRGIPTSFVSFQPSKICRGASFRSTERLIWVRNFRKFRNWKIQRV